MVETRSNINKSENNELPKEENIILDNDVTMEETSSNINNLENNIKEEKPVSAFGVVTIKETNPNINNSEENMHLSPKKEKTASENGVTNAINFRKAKLNVIPAELCSNLRSSNKKRIAKKIYMIIRKEGDNEFDPNKAYIKRFFDNLKIKIEAKNNIIKN